MRQRRAAIIAAFLLYGCASGSTPDPTPARPRLACIRVPFGAEMNPRTGGKQLPEVVRVIGVTSIEDGERWKVLRHGETDPEKWLPYPKDEIQFVGCGADFLAFQQLMSNP